MSVLPESVCTYSVFISRYMHFLELRLGFTAGMFSFKFTKVFKEYITFLCTSLSGGLKFVDKCCNSCNALDTAI